jgi:DNA mismatch repair protein MutS2
VEKPVERQPVADLPLSRAIRLGDKVFLKTFNVQGVVSSLGEEEAEVQVGMLRIRAGLSELQLRGSTPEVKKSDAARPDVPVKDQSRRESPTASPARHGGLFSPSPGIELDLRGRRAEDALEELGRYLDASYLAGLPFVRIIHGKGTGKLRQAVRESLAGHPQVKSFEAGGEKEGGEGVTIARLSTS